MTTFAPYVTSRKPFYCGKWGKWPQDGLSNFPPANGRKEGILFKR